MMKSTASIPILYNQKLYFHSLNKIISPFVVKLFVGFNEFAIILVGKSFVASVCVDNFVIQMKLFGITNSPLYRS